MSKKKKKTAASKGSQKPEETKRPGQDSENYIMIEIPDKPEEAQAAQPEAKPEKKPETKHEKKSKPKPEKKPEPKPEKKPEPKPEKKPEPKPEKKPEPKSEKKLKPKPEKPAPSSAPALVKLIGSKLRKLKEIPASFKKAVSSKMANSPKKADTPKMPASPKMAAPTQKAAPPAASENPENEISIEVPDTEAEKLKTFTPQVTKPEKPPLTPEQIAAKKHRRRIILTKTADVVFLVILVLMVLLILFPIFFAAAQSVKTTAELGDVPQTFFPKDFTFKSFVSLFTSTGEMGVPFYRFVFNTVFVAAVVTILRILVTVPAAYVLAKVKAPMIKTLNRLVEISLVLTPALAFTLNNALIIKTRLADTYFAVILPFIVSPLCLVIIREAIRRIPDDSISALRLEGVSHPMILRKFVTPQIRPVIAAVAVLSLFEIGRISGGPLTFGETMDMLPAFMEQLSERGAVGEMYVLALLMLVPVVVLTVIFRKSILKAMTTASLKDHKNEV